MTRQNWADPFGNPLKFQDGDHVRIKSDADPGSPLNNVCGYVRGYDLTESSGKVHVGYELYRMGDAQIYGIPEDVIHLHPENVPHTHRSNSCMICGLNV